MVQVSEKKKNTTGHNLSLLQYPELRIGVSHLFCESAQLATGVANSWLAPGGFS